MSKKLLIYIEFILASFYLLIDLAYMVLLLDLMSSLTFDLFFKVMFWWWFLPIDELWVFALVVIFYLLLLSIPIINFLLSRKRIALHLGVLLVFAANAVIYFLGYFSLANL